MRPFDFHPVTRVVFGDAAHSRLGELARHLGFKRTLLVADRGMVEAGHVGRAAVFLKEYDVEVTFFHEFDANPDSRMVEAGRAVAAAAQVDSLVALGGGSSLDCAKGINFLLSGPPGAQMRDFRGYGKLLGRPMLPSIGVPTTAGTGSEAQSYALISDAETHAKMACGDPGAAFRVVILDAVLTVTQPRRVAAVAGYDALSHAVESLVTTKGTMISEMLAREAWRLLEGSYEQVLEASGDLAARRAMLVGAHLAGMAIEQSMLGAAHACANPLTARYGTAHGVAIGVMLPHVVRWNALDERVRPRYDSLRGQTPERGDSTCAISARLDELARVGGLPATLRELGASSNDLPALAADAATQWTGTFNPRPFDEAAALSLYKQAY